MLWIHIAGGSIALLAGFATLLLRKGSAGHRATGRAFAYAMFAMTVSGALMAAVLRPNPGNVLAAAVTFYLVASGWLAVRPGPGGAPRRHAALCALAAVTAIYGLVIGSMAWQVPGRAIGGIPAVVMGVFALVAAGGAVADLRLLRGLTLDAPRRVLRHLWRMGLALWVATMSFFLGQADEFPQAVRDTGLLSLPVLGVAATLVFWIVRQRLASRRADRARLTRAAATGLPASAG